MIEIGMIHYIYILFIVLIIVLMTFKKDIILVCILGLFTIGFFYNESVLDGIQTIYKGVIVSILKLDWQYKDENKIGVYAM